MKKIIVFLIIALLTSGCGLINPSNLVLPDDSEFVKVVEELDTPQKICDYMSDNFEYEEHPYYNLIPYDLYLIKKGDCYDLSIFASFIANYHNYETYQMFLYFKTEKTILCHAIVVYKEDNKYNYSNPILYISMQVDNFKDIIPNIIFYQSELIKYIVYDYDMNIIETMQ
jgi:hypothetical protein